MSVTSVLNLICELITAIATGGLAIAAWRGIDTWKKQIRANRQCDFLDELLYSVSEYINLMGIPIQCLKFIGIQLKSHENPPYTYKIDYLKKKCAKEDGLKLQEYLDKASSINAKINSLAVKGQILGFSQYSECFNVCTMLSSVFKDLVDISGLLVRGEHVYWKNPNVIKAYKVILELPENAYLNIKKTFEESNTKLLNFAQANYKKQIN